MRAVVVTEPGKVELNWSWLPTFIGMSSDMLRRMEKKLSPLLVGKPLTEETLDAAHELALDFICQEHHAIRGLRDYLDSLKFVEGPCAESSK
jgi:hypothetical protein